MKIRDRIKSLRRVKASQLSPHPANWRTHPEAQQDALRGVLAEIGYADALLARELPDDTLQLLDGHCRAEITPDAKVPVLILDLDDAEADKLLATLDPLAAMAEANQDALGKLLAGIETDSEALEAMLKELAAEHSIDVFEPAPVDAPEAQIDRATELQAEWKTELGQLWEVPGKAGTHRLLCGDNITASISGNIEIVVTDPPYGVNWNPDHRRFTDTKTKYTSVVGDNKPFDPSRWLAYSHVVLWGANCFSDRLPLGTWLVWDKRFKNGKAFLADAEVAWMKSGYGVYLYSEVHQGCVGQEVKGHPTQKSSGLMQWCIERVGGSGVVLDPFLGSGTTMVAAEQLGRVCMGIEIAPKYIAVALQRMADMGLKPKLTNTGT